MECSKKNKSMQEEEAKCGSVEKKMTPMDMIGVHSDRKQWNKMLEEKY